MRGKVASTAPRRDHAHRLPRGPVVVVGGFWTTAALLEPLRRLLSERGHDVLVHTAGLGLGCATRSANRLADVVDEHAARHGPVHVVGYSRGGQFARAIACGARPSVASLITLGTPFDLYGLRLPALLPAAAVTAAGSIGAPGLASVSCLAGRCCAEFRANLRHPVPVPFRSIFGRFDAVVRPAACRDDSADNVGVDTGHFGLITDRRSFSVIAAALDSTSANRGSS